MKLAHICPTKYIEKYGSQGDFTLALAHLIDLKEENEYQKAITKIGLPIILDNGLFENHTPEPLDSLIEKAEKIGATHLFAPDILYNKEETQKELEKTIKKIKEKKSKVKIAAVVQADNKSDYIKQLIDFNLNPDVDLIGLSILSIPKSFGGSITESRVRLLEKMKEICETGRILWKNCHLLGLGDSYRDVLFAKENCPWVVSNDTSSCFWNGVQKKRLMGEECIVEGGKTSIKVDFNFEGLKEDQVEIIQGNINKINKLCK